VTEAEWPRRRSRRASPLPVHAALAVAGHDVPRFRGDPADRQGWDGPPRALSKNPWP
jgi:hypothetical protein